MSPPRDGELQSPGEYVGAQQGMHDCGSLSNVSAQGAVSYQAGRYQGRKITGNSRAFGGSGFERSIEVLRVFIFIF